MKRRTIPILILIVATLGLGGCASVQPWERGALSLEPMKLEDCKTHRFERSTEGYREGAIGGSGAKGAGGCGCS